MAKGVKTGGRVAGIPNKRTARIEAEIAASGMTPLEYMLEVMRDAMNEPKERLSAAIAAAPYVHAKLASMELTGPGEGGAHLIQTIERVIVDPTDTDA